MSPFATSILSILRAISLFDLPLRRALFTVLARGLAHLRAGTPRMARVSFIDHHDMSRSAMWTRNTKRHLPVAARHPGDVSSPLSRLVSVLGYLTWSFTAFLYEPALPLGPFADIPAKDQFPARDDRACWG